MMLSGFVLKGEKGMASSPTLLKSLVDHLTILASIVNNAARPKAHSPNFSRSRPPSLIRDLGNLSVWEK